MCVSCQHFSKCWARISRARIRRCARRQLARLRFEIGHHLKGVDHILLAKRERNGAAIRQELHETLRRQHLDRLAQRCARDSVARKLTLVQFGTRGNGAFDQHAAQPGAA